MAKQWRILAHDAARIASLSRAAGVSSLVAQLLIARGIPDADGAARFLQPKLTGLRDPGELPGVNEAADLIHQAVRDRRRIVVYGDYDCDGMTATAILVQCLQQLEADVSYYVPHRLEEGYGLSNEALDKIAARGAQVVITVDCGIASVEEAAHARQLGLSLVITDHHSFGRQLPEATLVHPALPGHNYPFTGLCGAGVAFKLAWAICQRASESQRVSPPLKKFLLQAVGLAAIGTIADVVPLIDENRILVLHGLQSLKSMPPLGLEVLLRLLQLDSKPQLSGDDIAFSIAPRLNAAGRLGQAQLAIELLTTNKTDRALALAEYIHELNESRQSLERSIYLAARKQAVERFDPREDPALVLAGHGWHAGVIGIVAGRIAEKFHRPTVLISLDDLGVKPGVGSARSVPGFDLHAALQQCDSCLLSHGGHAAAAGLRIEEERLDEFREAFCEYASENITIAERISDLVIDAECPLSALTFDAVRQIEALAPFGAGNKQPLLCATDVTLCDTPKQIGGGGRHLSLRLDQHGQRLRCVAFGGGDWLGALSQHVGPIAIAYRPIINNFRGRNSVELQVVDWRDDNLASGAPRDSSRGVA